MYFLSFYYFRVCAYICVYVYSTATLNARISSSFTSLAAAVAIAAVVHVQECGYC